MKPPADKQMAAPAVMCCPGGHAPARRACLSGHETKSERVVPEAKCRFGDVCIRVTKVGEYRLYCLDGISKVSSADWIEAEDDEAAIEVAKNTTTASV